MREIDERLRFLDNVGIGYLSMDRAAATLSGGEAQRIRLATQIGSALVGVLYVLDEPSIGLHQRDNSKLIATLERLRALGNTVLVVEHDEQTMRAADHLVDLGLGAGEHGGRIVAQGTAAEVEKVAESLTGQFLAGTRTIPVPEKRRTPTSYVEVRGAKQHNLKSLDVNVPLGVLTCVTGVSGSGKSTLVNEVLFKAVANRLHRARQRPGAHTAVLGLDALDKIIQVDQSPIGRTPRSNPATYTGLFDVIRDLFSKTQEARARGYKPGRFSFNVKGGRCEVCRGDGQIKIEMHFLPDVYVPCEQCHGKRYNKETLDIRFKGKTIADVLDMPVEEAVVFFEHIPKIRRRLETLNAVGLGYIRLGQPATTLSGGEAQRVKLATRALEGRHRQHALHPRRADHGSALRRRRAPARRPAPPGRPGQLGGRHRAQPRRHQDRRPDHRHGPRGRGGRRRGHRRRHARGGRGHARLVHRRVPAGARRARGAQGAARHGQAQAPRGRDGLSAAAARRSLRHDVAMSATYHESPAPGPLASHACCVWSHVAGAGGHVERVLPDGCADVVWIEGEGIVVAGPATREVLVAIPAGGAALGVRFGPGATGAALGVAARELRDSTVALEDVWGAPATELAERLSAAPPAGRLGVLAAAVARRLDGPEPPMRSSPAPARCWVPACRSRRPAARSPSPIATCAAASTTPSATAPRPCSASLRLRRFLALAESGPSR